MSGKLPGPIAAYIAAENDNDPQALARCFAETAVVKDEGGTFVGRDAIQQWTTETHRKYHHTVEPIGSVRKGGKTEVTMRLTGNFPGSPIELRFIFKLQDNAITSLEIG